MTSRTVLACSILCALMLTGAAVAQENPAAASSQELDINGIPPARGVYYRGAAGWVALSPNVMMPFWDERAIALQVLNVGSDHTVTQFPGRHAGIQIASDSRPTFYLHGISPADLFIVHVKSKGAYREIRMHASGYFWDFVNFHDKDVTDFGIEGVNGDVIAIKPVTALQPGEYAVAALAGRTYQWLRLGFDFGIIGAVPGR